MTVDDELVLELLKPLSNGEIGKEALIRSIFPMNEIYYKLEESSSFSQKVGSGRHVEFDPVNLTPDIIVRTRKGRGLSIANVNGGITSGNDVDKYMAFEIENDIQWDFQSSLKQVKKYKRKYEDVRIIIPEDFQRFAPLYKNEGIKTYLWKAKRKWQCLRCGKEVEKEGPVYPKCDGDGCNNRNEFRLIGLTDCTIKEA